MSLQKEVLSLQQDEGITELINIFFDEQMLLISLHINGELTRIYFDSPYSVKVCGESMLLAHSKEEKKLFENAERIYETHGNIVTKFKDSYPLRKFNEESVNLYNEHKDCVHYRIVAIMSVIDIIMPDNPDNPRII